MPICPFSFLIYFPGMVSNLFQIITRKDENAMAMHAMSSERIYVKTHACVFVICFRSYDNVGLGYCNSSHYNNVTFGKLTVETRLMSLAFLKFSRSLISEISSLNNQAKFRLIHFYKRSTIKIVINIRVN